MWLSRRNNSIVLSVYETKEHCRNTHGGSGDERFFMLWILDVSVKCTFKVRFGFGSPDCCGREIHYEENMYSSILLQSSFTYFFRQARPGSNQGGVLRAYLLDIQGVDPDEEYQDPDSFYFDIARKVGIAQVARDAVGKEFGRKQNDKRFFMWLWLRVVGHHQIGAWW